MAVLLTLVTAPDVARDVSMCIHSCEGWSVHYGPTTEGLIQQKCFIRRQLRVLPSTSTDAGSLIRSKLCGVGAFLDLPMRCQT